MEDTPTLKILTLGDSSAGKTCIIFRYVDNNFPKNNMPTLGIEYKTKSILIKNQSIKLQIWDTAGQERYHKVLATTFYRRANGIVLVYDLNEKNTFYHVENWMKQIRQKADPGIEVVLVGNKLDLVEEMDFSEGKELAATFGIPFFVVSAKNGTNVDEVFNTLTDMIIVNNPKILKPTPSDSVYITENKKTPTKQCCS